MPLLSTIDLPCSHPETLAEDLCSTSQHSVKQRHHAGATDVHSMTVISMASLIEYKHVSQSQGRQSDTGAAVGLWGVSPPLSLVMAPWPEALAPHNLTKAAPFQLRSHFLTQLRRYTAVACWPALTVRHLRM